jgi:hypothetical protein
MSDRPSWRDIDRKRDTSRHTNPEARPGRAPRLESATAAYKRELEKIFKEGGGLPAHLKEKLGEPAEAQGDKPGNERQQRLRAVRQAPSGPDLVKALDELRKHHGLPDDLEILLRALEHPKDEVLREALALVEPHVENGDKLPNKKVFVERLKGLEFTSFDPTVQRKAAALVARLR